MSAGGKEWPVRKDLRLGYSLMRNDSSSMISRYARDLLKAVKTFLAR
jgi:hypothetical protein